MVNEDIVKYLKEGKKRGIALAALKKKLSVGGFDPKDIEEAANSLGGKAKVVASKTVKKVEAKPVTKVKIVKEPLVTKVDVAKPKIVAKPLTKISKPIAKKVKAVKAVVRTITVLRPKGDNKKFVKPLKFGEGVPVRKAMEIKHERSWFKSKKEISSPPSKILKGVRPVGDNLGVFGKIGKAIAHPVDLFNRTKGEGIWQAIKYLWIISLVPFIVGTIGIFFALTFLTGLLSSYGSLQVPYLVSQPLWMALIFFGWTFFGALILNLMFSGFLHLFILLFKGRGSYSDTFRANVYSSTPQIIFFFIPLVGVWSFILNLVGQSINHQISKGRVFLAMLTAMVVFVGIVAFLGYFVS